MQWWLHLFPDPTPAQWLQQLRRNTLEIKKNKKIVIPYIDQEMNFWRGIFDEYGCHISEVYFPITGNLVGTGRPTQPQIHLKEFLESKILPVSVLVNPVILPRPVEEMADSICEMISLYIDQYNLAGVTLSNLSLAQVVKCRFPTLKLTASVLMDISSDQQLIMLGDVFDTLVPSNRIIRDITALKKIRNSFRGRIRLIVNESCLSSCIFRTQHFFEMSNPEIGYPHSLCNTLLLEKPWLRLTGGWILPQHLDIFDGLYDEIKLAGRVTLQNRSKYMHVLDSYFYSKQLNSNEIGGGPASVNCPMIISDDFYRHTLSCSKNCQSCTYCKDYWVENQPQNG